MINTSIDISHDIGRLVEQKLREALEQEFNLAIEKFNSRKGEIVAGLIVRMMRTTDMRIMEDKIVFEIKNS